MGSARLGAGLSVESVEELVAAQVEVGWSCWWSGRRIGGDIMSVKAQERPRRERVARIDYRGARKDYRRPGEFQHERFKETRARFHTVEI